MTLGAATERSVAATNCITCKTVVHKPISEVYADGGVVSSSRSRVGGAAAYVCVAPDGEYVLQAVDAYVPLETFSAVRANGDMFISGELHKLCQKALGDDVRARVYAYREDTVTNNAMELLALVGALDVVHPGWCGRVCSDSMVTLGRAFAHADKTRAALPPRIHRSSFPWRMEGIHETYQRRLRTATGRLGTVQVVLLDGHPTATHLRDQIGKRGQPVSIHNKRCDELASIVTHVLRRSIKES